MSAPLAASSRRRSRPVGAAVAEVAVAAVACALAAAPVTVIYVPGPLPALLGAAAALGAGVTAGLRAAQLPVTAALSLSLLVLAAGLVALGRWLPRPDGSLVATAVAAARHSGARILTTSVPVPTSLETVVLPVAAAWLAATTAVLLLATRRPGLAVLPAVALCAGAVALVGPPRAPAYGYAVGLTVALVGLLALVERRASTQLRGLATAAFTAVLATTVALVGPMLAAVGDPQPPDLRAHVAPPLLTPTQVNPLSLLAGWAAEPDDDLLEVHTGQPAPLRWVVLSEFTGVTWLPAPHYRAAGAWLPPVVPAPASVAPARHEIVVTGLTGGWLPAPPGAREVHGVRVTVDAASGTLLAAESVAPGTRYTVGADLPDWQRDRHRLLTASLPTGEELDLHRALPPGAPGRLHEIARVAARTGTPFEQASRVATYLRENYVFDPEAPGGNGYPSLRRFLDRDADDGGRGTSEQFATAFAVLARSLGMPSRVVVGFGPGEPAGPDRYLVRTGDARAWAEVNLAGVGWVPFDPTPAASPPDEEPAEPAPPPERVPQFAPELPVAEPSPVGTPDPAAGPAASAPPPVSRSVWLGWLAVLAGLLGGVGTMAALRLRRSARHLGRGGPGQRLLGGWAELRDVLRLAGWRPGPASTVNDVAVLATEAVGAPRAAGTAGVGAAPAALAVAVNSIAFGGMVPPDTDVDDLLGQIRAYRRELSRRSGWLRGLTWWLDPRPLWWR